MKQLPLPESVKKALESQYKPTKGKVPAMIYTGPPEKEAELIEMMKRYLSTPKP